MKKYKLGDVIRNARNAKGISLRELSRRTGISHPYLSQIETGKNDNPSKEFLLKLNDELQLTFVFLLAISSTDMGLSIDITKEVIDKYRNYIPANIHLIDVDFFFNTTLSKDIKENPEYYTDEKIKEIKLFFYEVKEMEELIIKRSQEKIKASNIRVLDLVLNTPMSKSDEIKIVNDVPSLSLNQILSDDIAITVNDKPLTKEDKLKLLEIANTIFK